MALVRRHRWIRKTSVRAGHSVEQIMQYPICGGTLAGAGWQWVNLAWLAGGVWLLWQKAIRWHAPSAS